VPEFKLDNHYSQSDVEKIKLKLLLKLSEEARINSQDNKEFSFLKCGDSLE